MLVVMEPGAPESAVAAVVERLHEALPGLSVRVLPGELTTAIGAIGDPAGVRELGLEAMDGVDRVVEVARPYKLAAREARPEGTRVQLGDGAIGEGFSLILGPCTVETREQTLAVARAAKSAGAIALRGGAFKPRTSPFAFQGLGLDALAILAEARAETGLPIVTELTAVEHLDAVAEVADVIQIGARNMQHYALLQAAGSTGKPVLLKRGLSSTVEELLQAADYVLGSGSQNVILCERGIRTFETALRFTLDVGAIAWLKRHTHLPVIADPSHAAGDRRLVEPLALAAAAAGADGLIVEAHPDPAHALCDPAQQLTASELPAFAARVRAVAGAAAGPG